MRRGVIVLKTNKYKERIYTAGNGRKQTDVNTR